MTTLKPQLVRADTMDLQDQNAPSAKDHTRQPQHPSPYGYGPAAPHQAQTLRHAAVEDYQQQKTSPRASEDQNHVGPFAANQRFYDDPEDEVDDEHMNHLHGVNGANVTNREYDEDGDASDSHDEDMDDDLMDKISSSPSIEDGKYSLPQWPPRLDSMDFGASPAPSPLPSRGIFLPSSPFISSPIHFPLPLQETELCLERSHGQEDSDKYPPEDDSPINLRGIYSSFPQGQHAHHQNHSSERYMFPRDMDTEEITKYLLPIDDPLLENSFDEHDLDEGFYDDEDTWEDEDVNMPDYGSISDEETDFLFTQDSRFIDSGWGGECLREIEDIDFEFVYALHTFVATVEGQANATKGDTMVLLDDSNSYWWLVRVVKDGSIGYLPAEHIETPTERLARLNKHRNIDLSASMLGDNPEKSKNPLKKAMRRRNAKTVQFAPPTYYEPSDYEYSDEEDGDEGQMEPVQNGVKQQQTINVENHQADAAGSPREQQGPIADNGIIQRVASNESLSEDASSPDKSLAPEPLQTDGTGQDAVSRSRKGNVRNTDSFFKDDTAETKKISLTPRLLRGDSQQDAPTEGELRQRPSLETFDNMLGSQDKPKDDKKKEKKGMLSGLFKRKDKGAKTGKGDQDLSSKVSEDSARYSPSKESLDSLNKPDVGPERKPSKLQKHPPTYTSPKNSPTEGRAPSSQGQQPQISNAPPAPTGPAPSPPISRQVDPIDTFLGTQDQRSAQNLQPQAQGQAPGRFPSLQMKGPVLSPTTNAPDPSSELSQKPEPNMQPIYTQRAKERFTIETSDSDDDSTPHATDNRGVSPLNETQTNHRRNDSGMQISPIEPTAEEKFYGGQISKEPPAIDIHDLREPPKAETPPQNLEVTPIETEHTASTSKPSPSTVTTHTPSTSRSTPTWSDASLRMYMENDQDIKDLLIIVHDKSNVTPVGADHPLMTNLFSNERNKLAEMQTQLDSMLMTWMSRKNTSLLSR